MLKLSKLYLTLIIVFSLALNTSCTKTNNLLTNPLSQVSTVGINDYEHNSLITLDIKKDQEKISEIYKLIDSTKINDHSDDKEGQTSEPKFTIIFKYLDDSEDVIQSTETGQFIYRNVSSTGWIGGSNTKIHQVIDELP